MKEEKKKKKVGKKGTTTKALPLVASHANRERCDDGDG
jgi:hypothetical protein